jgi:O-antigen/teichoic acid export membrane protein
MFWKGVLGYLPVNIAQGVVGLLTILVFTRLLSPTQYSDYALAFSAMSLTYTLMFVWLEASMARFHAAEVEAGSLADHMASLYRAFVVMAVILPVVALAALWFWPMDASLKIAVGAGLGTILPRSLAKLTQERRRAAGEVAGAAMIDIVQTVGGFVIGVGLIFTGLGGGAPLIGVGAAAAVCLIWALPSELRTARKGKVEIARMRSYAAYGIPVSLSLILALVLATTDRFLLAAYLNETSVGVYHAGYSLANRTLDVMFIWLGMAGGPAAVAAYERGGRQALQVAAREQITVMLALTLPAAVGLALVAKPLAAVMIGEGLRDGAAQVTPWIAASAFLAGITTYYFNTAFTLGRRTGLLIAVMALAAGCNLGLNLVLIPRFGLPGALWATLISYGIGAGASFALGKRAVALPTPWGTVGRVGLATMLMAGAVSLTPAFGGIIELIAKAAVGVGVYGAAALALDVAGLRARAPGLAHALQARLAR